MSKIVIVYIHYLIDFVCSDCKQLNRQIITKKDIKKVTCAYCHGIYDVKPAPNEDY